MLFHPVVKTTLLIVFCCSVVRAQPSERRGPPRNRGRRPSASRPGLQSRRDVRPRVPDRPANPARRADRDQRPSAAQRALQKRRAVLQRVPGSSADPARRANRDRRLGRQPRVAPQAGTGRLGRDSLSRGRTVPDHVPHRRRTPDAVRQGRRRERQDRLPEEGRERPRPGRPEDAGLRSRFNPSRADRLLSKRLAAIDRLRDRALENGNEQLLDRADWLERLARRQHERRTFDGHPRDKNRQLPMHDPDGNSTDDSANTSPADQDRATLELPQAADPRARSASRFGLRTANEARRRRNPFDEALDGEVRETARGMGQRTAEEARDLAPSSDPGPADTVPEFQADPE